MDYTTPGLTYNVVRDWNKAQGFTHPSDEHIQIRRDINVRKVSVENSSERSVSIAIVPYPKGPIPSPMYTLIGGEIITLAVNPVDESMQYCHILDSVTKKPVGNPYAFRTDCNSFVLRDGLNLWYIQAFQTFGYRG